MSLMAVARPPETMVSGEWACSRCGVRQFTGKPNAERECASCCEVKLTPAGKHGRYRELTQYVPGLEGRCHAWLGEFDDHDNPIDANGFAVISGERLCGHRDCVQPKHVKADGLFG